MEKTTTPKAPHRGESYVWTDTEVESILSVTLKYKVNKVQENVVCACVRKAKTSAYVCSVPGAAMIY